MAKQIIVTCDCCGTDVFGKLYFIVNREIFCNDKQTDEPTSLCPKCFRLALLLLDLDDMSEKDY